MSDYKEYKHRIVEISKNPKDSRYWDSVYNHLKVNFPFHYYIGEDKRIKIKRAAKKKVFNYILKISKDILTQKQYEAFILYYDSYPRKTLEDISYILNLSCGGTERRLARAKQNIYKFFFENTKSQLLKNRLGVIILHYKEIENKASRKWEQTKEGKEYAKRYNKQRRKND